MTARQGVNSSASPHPPRARPGTFAGLFLITLSTLMYEIVLTRIFSVTMWYHFAFVAISVALFGLTAGALLVHLLPDRFRDSDVRARLWLFSLLFSLAIAVCFVTQLAIPFDPELNVASAWSIVLTCIVIAIPFVCSGVVVCLALTRFPAQTNSLYGADLVGAALGCILVVALFVVLDGDRRARRSGCIRLRPRRGQPPRRGAVADARSRARLGGGAERRPPFERPPATPDRLG